MITEETQTQTQEKAVKKAGIFRSKKFWIVLVIIVILVAVSLYQIKQASLTPEERQLKANIAMIEKVATLIMIPDEEPIIATIAESEKFAQEQAFYQGTIDGDKLIIFAKSRRAIIYSPSRNIIVNSGPFVINNPTTNTQAASNQN
jgi:hypothetical protein